MHNHNNLIVMLINCWYVSQRSLLGYFFLFNSHVLYKIVSKKLDFFHIYFMNIAINVNYLYV